MAFQNFSRLNNITFISSPASQYVSDEQPIGYHITRSSLESMVRYLAIEFSSKDIAVNAVRLGYVKSPSCKENRDLGFYSCDAVAVPRGFAPTPMEVANAIDQLSKIKTGILTGQTISLDAGLTLRSHASLTERTRTFFTSSQ
jgi:NAD(P)-dependent dehydrogenase (short-subunit alcohol dehydrogenase family)